MKKKILRIVSLLCAAMLLGGGTAMSESNYFGQDAGKAWYDEMLARALLLTGNNLRLLQMIERARAGEDITIATIGGSITEGAGASKYADCYASRFAKGFAQRYGAGDGSNVHFINAGVGGTPSTFGLMRYANDIVGRVRDSDGLPDLVVIEFAVNDYNEPTKHRCYESLLKTILSQPNDPVVILLFSVFQDGGNLQEGFLPIGRAYDVMMVSIRDGAYPLVGKEWTIKQFFSDEYHPTSLGHAVMADCLLYAVETAAAQEPSLQDIDLDIPPVYGDDFMGLQTIYAGRIPDGVQLDRGGFVHDDKRSFQNIPIGRVCGENFHHAADDPKEPLTFTSTFKKLLIAFRATNEADFGRAQVKVDGRIVAVIGGGPDKWGQSEVILALDTSAAAEHTVVIEMTNRTTDKKFTITAIGIVP
ncbi:MAG: SGNH/GDSL hydrolase family protein [Clostridia bacterium]|nr:SGNH/GDSL hydrolase family protein [Clostridia bacterium]